MPDPFSLKLGWIGESIHESIHLHTIWTLPNTLKKIVCQIVCLLHRLNCEYKEGKAFRFFSCDFVKEIYFHDVSDTCPYCFIRARVTPSQRTSATPYTAWALLQKIKLSSLVAELKMPTAHVLLGYLGVATMFLQCFFAWKQLLCKA